MPLRSARRRRRRRWARWVSSATPPTPPRIFSATTRARGTMPHALIGYAGSTLRAAEMFHETFPNEPLTVLVDYFGQEITDGLEVCRRFPGTGGRRQAGGAARHPWRALYRGARSRRAPMPCSSATRRKAIRGYRTETELRYLVGTGVSAAAIWHLRQKLDEAGFPTVRIVASSGFTPDKCRMMAAAEAPVDVVGTGSYLPEPGARPMPRPTSSPMTASRW